MSTITEFRVPAADTALGTTFETIPPLTCEIEQVITTDDLGIWLGGAEKSTITSALDADPSVVAYSAVTGDDDRRLYTVEFSEEIGGLFAMTVEEGGTLLTATATNGLWTLRFRFPHREDVSCVYDRVTERGVRVDITRIHTLSEATANEIGLTPEQYEALTAAIHHGYFEIPRDVSMEELSEELGISHQALSERLRRAYRTLVAAELNIDEQSETKTI